MTAGDGAGHKASARIRTKERMWMLWTMYVEEVKRGVCEEA